MDGCWRVLFCHLEKLFPIDILRDVLPNFSFSKHLDERAFLGEYLVFSEFVFRRGDAVKKAFSLLAEYVFRISDNPFSRHLRIIHGVPFDNLRGISVTCIYPQSAKGV